MWYVTEHWPLNEIERPRSKIIEFGIPRSGSTPCAFFFFQANGCDHTLLSGLFFDLLWFGLIRWQLKLYVKLAALIKCSVRSFNWKPNQRSTDIWCSNESVMKMKVGKPRFYINLSKKHKLTRHVDQKGRKNIHTIETLTKIPPFQHTHNPTNKTK